MFKTMSLAAALAVAAGAAQAATPQVKYDDLDLGRPTEAQAYKTRVARAVERTCEREATSSSSYAAQKHDCERRTSAAVTAALPEDVRTAYLGALNGKASDALTRARLATAETSTTAR